MKRSFLAILTGLTVTAQTALADPWFLHKFGELRAYHGDWLNVCDDAGRGQCRAVQSYIPKGASTFFGESRLALYAEAGGEYSIEVYDAGLPSDLSGTLEFDFGTESITLTDQDWRMGARDVTNVAETFVVPRGELATRLVTLIRAKNTLVVRYTIGDDEGTAPFSLRGSTAALAAIAKRTQP